MPVRILIKKRFILYTNQEEEIVCTLRISFFEILLHFNTIESTISRDVTET